jgi:hypothetical protein
MRIIRVGLTLLAMLACAAGCGSNSSGSSSAVLVTYVRSGGLPGIYEKLVVEESGSATVSQGLASNAKAKRFSVSDSDVAALRHDLDAADLGSQKNASPGACADCYVYDITYAGHHFTGDEATLPAAVHPAVTSLNAIIAQAGIEEPLATGK